MNIKVVESFYAQEVVFDVPTYELQQTKNPLYVGARVGQVARVHKIMAEKKIAGRSIGVWELGEYGYLDEDGRLIKSAFRKHGKIFFAQPERVPLEFRDAYMRLLNKLETL